MSDIRYLKRVVDHFAHDGRQSEAIKFRDRGPLACPADLRRADIVGAIDLKFQFEMREAVAHEARRACGISPLSGACVSGSGGKRCVPGAHRRFVHAAQQALRRAAAQ